jgi:hypothetical protein
MYADKEKERDKTRERVRRYRQKKQAEQAGVTPVTASTVTPINKMVCKCAYFKTVNNRLICAQCGKPAPVKGPQDKVRRGIELK